MIEAKDIKYSPNEQKNLEHLSNLLHLFHHRNKNQHRRSIWWRRFSVLRRQVNALVDDVATLNEVPTTHLERVRNKSRDKDTQLRISQRLDFWQRVLVPDWQNAFSQLVADGRFAVLGLFLVAVLAQVCRITRITSAFEDLDQKEVERLLNQFGDEHWGDGSKREAEGRRDVEDIGEVVVRDSVEDDQLKAQVLKEAPVEAAIETSSKDKTVVKAAKPPKKKRKKGDAIDDLFSTLD